MSRGWINVAKRLPKDGLLVLVFAPEHHDEGGGVFFDWIEDGCWQRHEDNYQHYVSVGGSNACGPDVVCTGPSQEAPYTHWMRIKNPDGSNL